MISDQETHDCFRRGRRHARLLLAGAIILIAFCFFQQTGLAQGRPIKATLVQNLEFGIIGATNITGTATMRSDGTKLVSSGILDLGGISNPAVFLIQGEKFTTFTISLPASATITLPGGPSAILTDFESNPAISGVLNGQGQATVTVGATMTLTPSLWEGSYGGVFDILVAYQ
jgi:hypothetical protein